MSKLIQQIDHCINDLIRHPLALFTAGLLSLCNIFLIILCYYLLAIGLSIELSLSELSFAIPLIFIASALPISVGGFGIREGATILLLMHFGVDEAASIAIAGLYLIIFLTVTAPAALLVIGQKREAVSQAQ